MKRERVRIPWTPHPNPPLCYYNTLVLFRAARVVLHDIAGVFGRSTYSIINRNSVIQLTGKNSVPLYSATSITAMYAAAYLCPYSNSSDQPCDQRNKIQTDANLCYSVIHELKERTEYQAAKFWSISPCNFTSPTVTAISQFYKLMSVIFIR